MKSVLLFASAAMLAVSAADQPSGFVVWSAADLKAHQQKLSSKVNAQKFASDPLGNFGNHTAMLAHRQGDGEAEVHENMADVFVVESGEATLVYGGRVVNPKTTAPNEVRGPSIQNAQTRKLAPGDVVHIPVKMPHQLLVEKGKQFTYFVVKVRSDK